MKKTAISLILAASMIGGVTTAAAATPAKVAENPTVKAQQEAYNNAQAQLEAAQTNLEQISNEISNLTREINNNNVQIAQNEAQLKIFTQEYQQDLITEGNRLKEIYMANGNTTMLSMLLSAKNLGQFLSAFAAESQIMKLDAQAVQKTQAAKNSIATTTTNLNNLKASNESKLKELNSKKASAQDLVTKMQGNSAMQAQKLAQAKANAQASIKLLEEAKTASQVNNAVTALKSIAKTTSDASVQKEVSSALTNNADKITTAKKEVPSLSIPATIATPKVSTPEPAAKITTQSKAKPSTPAVTTNNNSNNNSQTATQAPAKQVHASAGNSALAQQIISYAEQFLGDPYVWGATGPNEFDCSGLTGYVYAHFGYNIGYSTYTQIDEGTPVATNNLQPGDLIFWGDPSAPYHVAIYIGGGEYIQAPHTGANVDISSWNLSNISAARRIL